MRAAQRSILHRGEDYIMFSVRVPRGVLRQVREACAADGMYIMDYIATALREYLQRQEQEGR